MSRLVGIWIISENHLAKVTILKGEVMQQLKNHEHELLSVESQNKVYLIDPTVWQIFPDSEHIVIGVMDSREVFPFLEKSYGGHWTVAELLNEKSAAEEQKLITTLCQTIREIEAE